MQAIKETKIHGNIDFPYASFSGRIPRQFREFPVHYHDFFEIIFIVKGTMKVVIERQEFFPQMSDIVLVPPKTEHGFFQNESDECFYYTILFNIELIDNDEKSATYKKYLVPYKNKAELKEYFIKKGTAFSAKIFPSVTYLIRHRHERYTTNELMIKSKLCELIFYFQEILVEDKIRDIKNSEKLNVTRLKPVLNYIYQNFNRKISVREIADYAGYSESYFMTLFKKTTNLSVVDFINQIRIKRAGQLLCETDLRVSEISMQVDFGNFSYFIRCFKKEFGKSPSAFRKSAEFKALTNI